MFNIKKPKDTEVKIKNDGGTITAEINWNDLKNWERRYGTGQSILDSEVLRTTTPYVPIRTSELIRSGQRGTPFGSGEVNWIAPYAKHQYYGTEQTRAYDPRRGGKWFERSKVDNMDEWIRQVKKVYGDSK